MFLSPARKERAFLCNNFPNSVYFAVTWALRTCAAVRRVVTYATAQLFPAN